MTGKEFAQRIDACLEERNQTRKALTHDLGIASSTMSGWSASKNAIPRADVVEAIAQYFDVSTDWLITGRERGGVPPEDVEAARRIRSLSPANRNAVLSLLDALYRQEQDSAEEKNTAG